MQAESLEVLEKAEVPAQARAIVRAIDIEIAGAKDTLATKHDLALLRQELADFRVEMRSEMKSELAKLEARLSREISGVVRQMYTAVLGQMAVLLGFAYFFATHLR